MSECKGCGAPQFSVGAPIWEDVCTNKDCTYDKDQFKLQMREHGERMRKGKALRDAAPDLYEALEESYINLKQFHLDLFHTLYKNDKIEKTLAKARGEQK